MKFYESEPTELYEFCGRVCRICVEQEGAVTHKYYFRPASNAWLPTPTAKGNCPPNLTLHCLDGDQQVGTYHNHPFARGGGSGEDEKIAAESGDIGLSYPVDKENDKTEIIQGKKFPINENQIPREKVDKNNVIIPKPPDASQRPSPPG